MQGFSLQARAKKESFHSGVSACQWSTNANLVHALSDRRSMTSQSRYTPILVDNALQPTECHQNSDQMDSSNLVREATTGRRVHWVYSKNSGHLQGPPLPPPQGHYDIKSSKVPMGLLQCWSPQEDMASPFNYQNDPHPDRWRRLKMFHLKLRKQLKKCVTWFKRLG